MAETPEAQEKAMQEWGARFGTGDSVVDIGNPFSAHDVKNSGSSNGGASQLGGYSIINAESLPKRPPKRRMPRPCIRRQRRGVRSLLYPGTARPQGRPGKSGQRSCRPRRKRRSSLSGSLKESAHAARPAVVRRCIGAVGGGHGPVDAVVVSERGMPGEGLGAVCRRQNGSMFVAEVAPWGTYGDLDRSGQRNGAGG